MLQRVTICNGTIGSTAFPLRLAARTKFELKNQKKNNKKKTNWSLVVVSLAFLWSSLQHAISLGGMGGGRGRGRGWGEHPYQSGRSGAKCGHVINGPAKRWKARRSGASTRVPCPDVGQSERLMSAEIICLYYTYLAGFCSFVRLLQQ